MSRVSGGTGGKETLTPLRIRESGNSAVVTLDRDALADSDLDVGDQIVPQATDDGTIELVSLHDAVGP